MSVIRRPNTLQTACGRNEEYVCEIGGVWKFGGKEFSAEDALCADHCTWKNVSLPHTWNTADGECHGTYERTVYWYHKELDINSVLSGKRVYIEFLGANAKAELYVNRKKAGEVHKGGYTAFRYDVTGLVCEGSNIIDVMIDNRDDAEIAPVSGDFNIYGGLYRRVYLIIVDDIHIDLDNNGSSGLFLTTGNMRSLERPQDIGRFTLNTEIVNASDTERIIDVAVSVEGTNAPTPLCEKVTLPAKSKTAYSKEITVPDPVLWEGRRYDGNDGVYGYQYTVSLELSENGTILDRVQDKLGFRYFYINDDGFYLNGISYPLRGANRHSFLAGFGSALTEEQHLQDMEIMLELGVSSIRLCHYPHTDYFYDLCDDNGIVVWTEIPLVNMIGEAVGFEDNVRHQLTELMLQQYNRPSVIIWGIENEIGNCTDPLNATAHPQVAKAKRLVHGLDALAHKLDTTGRYTAQAVNRDYALDQNDPDSVNRDFERNIGWKSDIIAYNIYPGWYPEDNFRGSFDEVVKRKSSLDSRPFGISEYGWGSNASQHEAYPELGKNNLAAYSSWHPEEYQSIMHEDAVSFINRHNELWCTYCWVMFDFAVSWRNEGGQPAINDKGLVTANRQIKKDSFYLYKANWNREKPFVHITSRRWTEREAGACYVKVYSNCDKVSLFINDESFGEMISLGNGIFIVESIPFTEGDAKIEVYGNASACSDSCTWHFAKAAL